MANRFPLDLRSLPESTIPSVVRGIEKLLRKKGLEWDELRQILALRAEFFEIDMRFGQLGPRGIFSMMDAKGRSRSPRQRHRQYRARHTEPAQQRARQDPRSGGKAACRRS